ncbi:hypothetical protein Cgig2_015288 [Carnegiea gigantea]|uniref:Aminotransferase-like plant mobile domain-containing protein n=1 Tax=Carnegiea gigantea TaxID=171969 RepID=A0A9Q1QE99_9CARY|nr:hypothetical protein Cgig2_015288 [Carnegiea gigantea]
MDEIILERGEHGADFKRDFVVYAISTCIMGNANGTCHFRILKYLLHVDRIHNYSWCGYVIKCLNATVVDWQADRTKYFTGSFLFLMLCYINRVELQGKRIDRWFPTIINWTTEDVKKREKDERLLRKLDYENIMHIAEMDLQQELEIRAPDQHGELQINGDFGTASISYTQPQYWKRHIQPLDPTRNEPIQVPNSELRNPTSAIADVITLGMGSVGSSIPRTKFTLAEILSHIARAETKRSSSSAYKPISDSIEKTCDDGILFQDDDVFRDPKFLKTLSHVESEAIAYLQKEKSMGVTPPSVKLPISSKKGACLSPTLHFTPPSFSLGFSPEKGEAASPHEQVASSGREHPKSLKESSKENMSPNIIAKLRLQHNNGNQFLTKGTM